MDASECDEETSKLKFKLHQGGTSVCVFLKRKDSVYIFFSCLFTFAGIVPWRSDITKHEVTATLQWLTNEMEIIYRNNQDLYRTNVIFLFHIYLCILYLLFFWTNSENPP